MSFPVGWDNNNSYSAFSQSGAISPFPLDVVVDRKGVIAYINREYDSTNLQAAVDALMSQP